ncbi:hypothetical protein [Paractinoplanes lichenicola]|uniref:Uncharacterized protein n=1 Tax=Paractinoplanes lichenicola TaxID=2802976 RepID=A0ABS1VW74_9ACTN|nr:hypothetical protein [Actinoplanes lichenicola]MBL7258739.1 hypothetical protein [Actinoplanes lichenicola]
MPDFLSRMADWHDSDQAAYELAVTLGALPPGAFAEHKWLFWTGNPLGDGLRQALLALTTAGLLDHDADGDRFRRREEAR